MIASLADAWRWYESARTLTLAMARLGAKHWKDLPWEGSLGRDERLKSLDRGEIRANSQAVLEDLDDLCVLLLFSVFEANIRSRVLAEIEIEVPGLRHVALRHAVATLREAIQYGSFFRILEPYKPLDANLIEKVNQVRRYRNWVAHGRRGPQPPAVSPQSAYMRLQQFLVMVETTPPRTLG
ncbi:MAG TPA: hypothetical protein VFA26_10660 [Gemmataceae bacterium]|nr:hypothetical protein [Gemmataceae bacterium]